MKHFWKPLQTYSMPTEIPFPRLFSALTGITAGMITLISGAVTLDSEQLMFSLLIWRLLALPMAMCVTLFLLCSVCFHCFCFWRQSKQLTYAGIEHIWKVQAADWIRLAEHASIFPVDNAALKMLKLEGEMPADADIPRRLALEDDETSGMSRIQIVVQQLLAQLDLTHIDAASERPELYLYIKNATETVRADVATALQAGHAAFKPDHFHFLEDMPQLSLVQDWTDQSFTGFRLLLIAELHEGDKRDFCEYACALLFSRHRQITSNRVPVCCFKGMNAEVYHLGEKLNVLLAAEQIAPADLRHVWTGNLQGESLHLLMDSLKENQTGVNVRSWQHMRLANTWASGYPWLMLEWSAQAIRNGQRGQMIAARESRGEQIMFLQMNSDIAELKKSYSDVFKHYVNKLLRTVGCAFLFSLSLALTYASYQAGWAAENDFLLCFLLGVLPFIAVLTYMVFVLDKAKRLDAELKYYYRYE
ncbi:hypothetical protein CIG19_09640 [Enterobacterales bacterium CwR94]|nr:hypothetical protein CIG19_09640 [Enterobacterales bacterium CwR94]